MSSKDFRHIEIGSMWINQTIRNTNAATKVQHFKRLPLEVNNQGWKIVKTGETYSLSFSLYRGRKKRIPLEIHQASHQEILDQIIDREAQPGSTNIILLAKDVILNTMLIGERVKISANG